ncbi:hypothetical protein [Mesorhizobium sp.]|nr:hypothetical protein [Mesorhizobium sp.]
MSRRNAFARAFVALLSHGRLLWLAVIVVLGALATPALAAGKD